MFVNDGGKKRWNADQTASLLQKYLEHPELFDSSSKAFKDRNRKDAAYTAMAEHFDTTEEEVMRKLHNLRCQMNQQIRKMKLCKEEGKVFVTSWQYFDAMALTINSFVWNKLTDGLVGGKTKQ